MDAITLVDTVLDRSVVLGYGNTGLDIRRRFPGWPAGPTRMDGKSVLVTGAVARHGRIEEWNLSRAARNTGRARPCSVARRFR